LIKRIAEDFDVTISFSPKLFRDFSGSGGHANFSTTKMREGEGGMSYIEQMIIKRLAKKHNYHLEFYGDNS